MEGHLAAQTGKFPPHNPYAPFGLSPGEEGTNPEGAAWFYGYWAYFQKTRYEPPINHPR